MAEDYNSDSEQRKHTRESCNHDLLKSEDDYVNMLEAIVQYVVKPLQQNADRCKIKPAHAQFTIRDSISVVPDFYKYRNFIKMYKDYLDQYDDIIKVFSCWRSMEFRDFVRKRLQNEKVKKSIQQPQLSTLPWYLYRPFDRVKEYYRFLKDLDRLSKDKDDDRAQLTACIQSLRPVYRKIKQNEERLQTKTRLLEVQLQFHGDYKGIVADDRYFIFKKRCQMRRRMLGKKYKQITIFLFNDLFIWVSARQRYKGSYSLWDSTLELTIPKNTKKDDAEIAIGLASEKTKRLIVFASDQQRDTVMGQIRDIWQKCQDKANSADADEKAAIRKKQARDTNLQPEFSQSSAADGDRENSMSISESGVEYRVPKGSGFSAGLQRIAEHKTTDDENGGHSRAKNDSASLLVSNKHLHIQGYRQPDTAEEESIDDTHSISIQLNSQDKPGVNDGNSSNSSTGAAAENGKVDQLEQPSEGNRARSSRDERRRDKDKERDKSRDRRDREKSRERRDKDDKDKRRDRHKDDKHSKSRDRDRDRHHHTRHREDKSRREKRDLDSEKEKIIIDLRQTIAELELKLERKDEHIKTLELSNKSIRDTNQVLQTQLARVQHDLEAAQKRPIMHPRTQSLAGASFSKGRLSPYARINGGRSPSPFSYRSPNRTPISGGGELTPGRRAAGYHRQTASEVLTRKRGDVNFDLSKIVSSHKPLPEASDTDSFDLKKKQSPLPQMKQINSN